MKVNKNMIGWISDKEENYALDAGRNFSLDNMILALECLGNPHLKLKNVIHIAGTNGKGSTATFICSILAKSGYIVNKYTSPHMVNFNERIAINGKSISDNLLARISNQVQQNTSHIKLSFFEATTLMAICAFTENNADFNVIETGLGGMLDSTNIFPKKLCSVITSISFDHQKILGNTISDIAHQKAGIMPNSKFTVIAKQHYSDAIDTLVSHAKKFNVSTILYNKDFTVKGQWQDFRFSYPGMEIEIPYLSSGLIGNHQIDNAASAIAVCANLNRLHNFNFINHESIVKGVKDAFIPGRIQKIPVQAAKTIIPKITAKALYCDGSHNEDSILKMAQYISKEYKNDRKIAIFSCLKDKNIPQIFAIIDSIGFSRIIVTEIQNNTRAASCDSIKESIAKYTKIPEIIECKNIRLTLETLVSQDQNQESVVIIFGSLFLAGEFFALLNKND